ncbi:hypothetical protein D3C87_1670930 [compost metagenome]
MPQGFGAQHLGHTRLDIAPTAFVQHPGAMPNSQARAVQRHLVVRQHEADALVFTQGFAERIAGSRVVAGDIVGPAGSAQPTHAVGQPRGRQAHLRVAEALADFAQHIGGRNPHIFKTQD